MRAGAFAARAGVTVRTLRYYDQIGLLKPSAHAESGQRLYSDMDYARLQQILTLKLIGLPLEDIKHLLTTDPAGIQDLLGRQRAALQQQMNQLAQVIQTIDRAQAALQASQRLDWEQFIAIIRAVNMNTQTDWLAQFMTQEQVDTLADIGKGWTLAEQKRAGEAWKGLFHDVRANLDKDVRDPAVQQLVDRLDTLLDAYSQDNTDFVAAVTRAYMHLNTIPDMADAPPEIREWAQQLREAAAFMQRAREAREQR